MSEREQQTAEPDHKTPAGGHAAGDDATAPVVSGVAQREVAAAPSAGRSIEATTGIRPACPTCEGSTRETVNMVCPTCGFDYGTTTGGGCHPRCTLGPNADHPGYLEYRCITDAVDTLPWPGEDGYVDSLDMRTPPAQTTEPTR